MGDEISGYFELLYEYVGDGCGLVLIDDFVVGIKVVG